MPKQIPGLAGSFYEPGERKGNRTYVWRGRTDDGVKIEIVTDAFHPTGAAAYVRKHLQERSRRRPPPARAEGVTLATVDRHYRAERNLDQRHPDTKRLDYIIGQDGEKPVGEINNAVIRATGEAWLDKRRDEVTAAWKAESKPRPKMPSIETANREVITPYRALMHYAVEQEWRSEIVVKSLRPEEGVLPKPPPPIADDDTVLKLLEVIQSQIDSAPTRWTREKNLLKRAFVWLVHERGYRVSEWMRFDWEWVDLPNARARMAITKNKNDLRWEDFELTPTAVAFLADLGPRDAGRIFPWHSRSNIYRWADICLTPHGKKWRPHESRRAIVSHIVAQTGDYKQAGRYVGHASERTTYRYRILRQPDLAPEVRFKATSKK